MRIMYLIPLTVLQLATTMHAAGCNIPFGMSSGQIKDNQITASDWLYYQSSINKHYAPYLARLNTNSSSGGWCSEDTESVKNQYIQVDLLENKRITSVATQGRYGSLEYVQAYKVEYQRDHDHKFRQYIEDNQWKLFKANTDSIKTKRQVFNRPIIARRIRIYPVGTEFAINCMRLEIYGCDWAHSASGLLDYEAPLGTYYANINMRDISYDGEMSQSNTTNINGIGKLADDIYGTDELDSNIISPWLAFSDPVPEISFRFFEKRLFKQVVIHVNKISNDDEVFEKVGIYKSLDGVKFSLIKYYYPSTEDYYQKKGAFVNIVNLGVVLSRYIKLIFTKKTNFLLISEVAFASEQIAVDHHKTIKPNVVKTIPIHFTGFPFYTRKLSSDVKIKERKDFSSNKSLSFPVILTISLVTLLIAISVIVFIFKKFKKSGKNSSADDDSSTTHLKKASPVSHSLSFSASHASHQLSKQHANSLLYDDSRMTFQYPQQTNQNLPVMNAPLIQDGMLVYPVMQSQNGYNKAPLYISS